MTTETDLAAAIEGRLEQLDWPRIIAGLDGYGCALTGQVLTSEDCAGLIEQFRSGDGFRSRVVMAAHGYGRGEYRYFSYPLPPLVAALRASLYPPLAALANRWGAATGYPGTLEEYLKRCHEAGQVRPTPLLLQYGTGDYNCLHQDLYGEHLFPVQATFLLSAPGSEFTGGEFALTEQRPRMQSRVEVVTLQKGEGVIFAVNQRPVQGSRGSYRVTMRHGVSRVRSGQRYTLGVIFHDAR